MIVRFEADLHRIGVVLAVVVWGCWAVAWGWWLFYVAILVLASLL